MLSGKPDRAPALLEAQLAAGWDTAEAYWVLGEALGRLGRGERAAEARAQALARNPFAERMYALPR